MKSLSQNNNKKFCNAQNAKRSSSNISIDGTPTEFVEQI